MEVVYVRRRKPMEWPIELDKLLNRLTDAGELTIEEIWKLPEFNNRTLNSVKRRAWSSKKDPELRKRREDPNLKGYYRFNYDAVHHGMEYAIDIKRALQGAGVNKPDMRHVAKQVLGERLKLHVFKGERQYYLDGRPAMLPAIFAETTRIIQRGDNA